MTKHPRPTPAVTRLETRGPDGTVIARMELRPASRRDAWPWVLELLPGHRKGDLPTPLVIRDGCWATKAQTVEDARSVLDYATHALLTYLERLDDAADTLHAGLGKASSMAAQQTLPLED